MTLSSGWFSSVCMVWVVLHVDTYCLNELASFVCTYDEESSKVCLKLPAITLIIDVSFCWLRRVSTLGVHVHASYISVSLLHDSTHVCESSVLYEPCSVTMATCSAYVCMLHLVWPHLLD